jgi:hypothetical protein
MHVDEITDTCDRCRFWEHYEETPLSHLGFCRRYAPRSVAVCEAAEYEARFALTDGDEWCGEFAPAPDRPAPSDGSPADHADPPR